jgi:hypothetical protein
VAVTVVIILQAHTILILPPHLQVVQKVPRDLAMVAMAVGVVEATAMTEQEAAAAPAVSVATIPAAAFTVATVMV